MTRRAEYHQHKTSTGPVYKQNFTGRVTFNLYHTSQLYKTDPQTAKRWTSKQNN